MILAKESVSRTEAPGKTVGAALSTVRILRHVSEQAAPSSSTEIARALALNPSTCFNIVQTLLDQGFLEAASGSKRYQPGPALTGLAHRLTARSRSFEALRPAMQAIADRYKLTVTLWIRRSTTRMELILVTSGNTAVNIQMPAGQRLPLLVGGMGRVMALESGLDKERIRAVFEEIKWERPLGLRTLLAQAAQAQRQGWGLDDGYMHRAVTAIGVPVRPLVPARTRAAAGPLPVEYVCSATMFRHQYSRAALEEIAKALQTLARDVATVLAGKG